MRTLRQWFALRRVRRRFRTTPAFAIGELPEDTDGKITGDAQPADELVEAPISRRKCMLYVVEVVHVMRGDELPARVALREQRGVPFVVAAGDARAVIDPTDAITSLVFDARDHGRPVFNTPLQYELLARHDLLEKKWRYLAHLEYREAVVTPGEKVSVLGAGTREPDPQAAGAAYRDGGRTWLRLTSSAKYPLVITDDARLM